MKFTSHELANILLQKDDVPVKLGIFVSNQGNDWFEQREDINLIFGEEGLIIEEDYE